MDATNTLRIFLKKVGYGDGKFRVIPLLFVSVSAFFGIASLLALSKVWNHNMIHRFMALKDFNIMIIITALTLHYWLSPNMRNLMNTADGIIVDDRASEKYKATYFKEKSSQVTLLKNTRYVAIAMCFIVVFCPLFTVISGIYFSDSSISSVNSLPLPIAFWFPESYDNIRNYFLVYFLQCFSYLVEGGVNVFLIFASIVIPLHSVRLNMILMRISIEDLNLHQGCGNYLEDQAKLKSYLIFLIQQHQCIFKNVRSISKNIGLTLTLANQCTCFEMCVYMYCVCEMDQIMVKIGYATLIFLASLVMYAYSNMGQQIITENERIRYSLAGICWLGKPKWFQKSLITMISRTNSPVHVKAFGVYVLNLRSYVTIMQVAYSYFHTLRTFKEKSLM